jgi:hypothetical protein
MIIKKHIVSVWNAAINNEPFAWSDNTLIQPRTEAGVILIGSGLLSMLAIFSEFSLYSPASLIIAIFPALVFTIGIVLALVSLFNIQLS